MKIETVEQFDRLFRALALELTYANVHYKLFLDVNSSFNEYKREVNQANAFWGIARDAIRDVAFLGLCRVYDPEPKTNSLPNLLKEIRDNPDFLEIVTVESSTEAINARQPKRLLTPIDQDQLIRDIEFVTKLNPAVKRLIAWRSNIFVHRNARNLAEEKPLALENMPRYEDLESLLKDGMKIINRYAGHFRNTEYSTQLVGGDDFRFVLECIRESLAAHEAKIAAEMEKYGLKAKEL